MLCPRCEQGEIWEVLLPTRDELSFLCDECDALWLDEREIAGYGFMDFGLYMRSNGFEGRWEELRARKKKPS